MQINSNFFSCISFIFSKLIFNYTFLLFFHYNNIKYKMKKKSKKIILNKNYIIIIL